MQTHSGHTAKNASSHVLARVRTETWARLKESKEVLGLAPDTVKGIMSSRSEFKPKSAQIVSRLTGVAVSCLLENNPNKPLVAVNGKRWNRKFYESFKTSGLQQEVFREQFAEQYVGTRLINNQRILSLKVACALIAAYEVGQSDLASFRIRQAIEGIETDFIDLNADKTVARKSLRDWDYATQLKIGQIRPARRNMSKRWAVIWKEFYSKISPIYNRRIQSKPTPSKSSAKPAEPPRHLNHAANSITVSIIEEGSPRHNAHIKYLKAAAKKGDKAAIANLKQRNIELDKTDEKLRR